MKKGISILVSHAAFLAIGVMALLIISAMVWNVYDSVIKESIRKDLTSVSQTVASEIVRLYSLKDSPAVPEANTSVLLGESSLALQQKAGGRQYSIALEEGGDFRIYLKTLAVNAGSVALSGYALYAGSGAAGNGAFINATVVETGSKNATVANQTGHFNLTIFTSLSERKYYALTVKVSDGGGKNSFLSESINLNDTAKEENNNNRLALESENPIVKIERPLFNIETKMQGSALSGKPVRISYYRYNSNGAVEDRIVLGKAGVFVSVSGIANSTVRGYANYANGSVFSGNVQAKIGETADFASNATTNGNFTLNLASSSMAAGKPYTVSVIASDGSSSGQVQKRFVYG
ncbi:MAG: hypothetical protein WA139_05035 [Candidatus Aenigmatarchaeota archaeon]